MASQPLLYRRNPLTYPAGVAPGFDPTHPASQDMSPGHGLSAVATAAFQDGNMVNLLTGRPGTTVVDAFANPGFMNGYIGPSIVGHGAGAPANSLTFSGNAAVVDTGQTLAAIIYYLSAHTNNPALIASGTVVNSAWYLYVDGATKQLGTYTASGALSGIVLTTNTPYFVACSNDGSNLYFIVKSLSNGRVTTAKVVGTGNVTSFTSSGTYTVQSDTFDNQAAFPIAAVSYTPAFLSPSQLMQWSQEPWAFWYPRKLELLVAAAAAIPYSAFYTPQHDDGRAITQMVGY